MVGYQGPIVVSGGGGGGGSPFAGNVVTVTGDTTLANQDQQVTVDITTPGQTITMPGAPTQGRIISFVVAPTTSEDFALDGNGNEIDASTSFLVYSKVFSGGSSRFLSFSYQFQDGAWVKLDSFFTQMFVGAIGIFPPSPDVGQIYYLSAGDAAPASTVSLTIHDPGVSSAKLAIIEDWQNNPNVLPVIVPSGSSGGRFVPNGAGADSFINYLYMGQSTWNVNNNYFINASEEPAGGRQIDLYDPVPGVSFNGQLALTSNGNPAGSVPVWIPGPGVGGYFASNSILDSGDKRQGVATLTGGTVTIATTAASTTMGVQVTCRTASGTGSPGVYQITNVVPGVSFDIESTWGGAFLATDTADVSWFIFEP
ncbi:MAG: hypothetical protein K2X29_11185 [Candidatus Obscuribacterales bacterium]|nr:hypothetical protein [Candidatus Obscuribacterales bacterium]